MGFFMSVLVALFMVLVLSVMFVLYRGVIGAVLGVIGQACLNGLSTFANWLKGHL